ncbi:MAG: YbdK family carboxylate-amine ligase [Actinomycetota bacterium]|nr:YbdK family carboxylate-amine ligase [Actinomycetota bacterium]
MSLDQSAPTAEELEAAFAPGRPMSLGLEEEVMLLEPGTLDLAPVAREVLAAALPSAPLKLELPASQVEITVAPAATVEEALADLTAGRHALVEASSGLARPACAGVHPFAAVDGVLNSGERYERTLADYGPAARRQLVCALQVHVAVGGPERALAVYNALRSYLPELAALAANAPWHTGRDSGLASIRPKLAEALPRQGIPPMISSWEAFADELRWGLASATVPEPRRWWWELRPHPSFGTLELRVPDSQTTLRDAGAIAAVAHSLVGWLAGRHDAGEALEVANSWRIGENRWSALRWGVEGSLADLKTGHRRPTRDRLHHLLDELEPAAAELGCVEQLTAARALVERNGASAQREVAAGDGARALAGWLAERFLDDA